tara:strand:- start:1434 stop:1616 length:183 start_codon:yes stop_codon:yes gene_type:complete
LNKDMDKIDTQGMSFPTAGKKPAFNRVIPPMPTKKSKVFTEQEKQELMEIIKEALIEHGL